jgi:hypothetical protein
MTHHVYETLSRALRFVVAVAVVGGAIAGCASGNHASTAGPGASNTSVSSPQTGSAAVIDACALVAADDVSALLGTPVAGQSTSTNPQSPGCKWENPSTDESVSVQIGNPGTAVNNTLAPAEPGFEGTPGPDGMRLLGGGQVEFAAGARSNTVQVAVLRLSTDDANAAAVDLAHKMAPKIQP